MESMIPDGELPYEDLPLAQLAEMANKLIEKGHLVFMKFTCEKCGARLTFEEPNTFYKEGSCDQCGHVTEIKHGGFMVAFVHRNFRSNYMRVK